MRHKSYLKNNYVPIGDTNALAPGTYYLNKVDAMFKREYSIK